MTEKKIIQALRSMAIQLQRFHDRNDKTSTVMLSQTEAHTFLGSLMAARVAIVDNRFGLGLNAERESDFLDLEKLVGRRVLIVDYPADPQP